MQGELPMGDWGADGLRDRLGGEQCAILIATETTLIGENDIMIEN